MAERGQSLDQRPKFVGEPGSPLLDHTQVLFGSILGNASSHDTPLSNLFVSLLQGFGIETEKFGASTGPLSGLNHV